MQCPKCDTSVIPGSAECPACGVILTKAAPRFVPPRRTPMVTPGTKPPASTSSSTLIKLAIAILGVWLGWHLLAPKLAAYRAWYEGASGYEAAIAEHRSSGKPVMLYFHADWCGYCTLLERDVLSTSTFQRRYGSTLLKVRVNPEKSSAERSLASDNHVGGYPWIVIITSNRTSDPIAGYGGDTERFYSRLDEAMKN